MPLRTATCRVAASTSQSSAWLPTPDGAGYWLVASDGGIFGFGDAHFYGSTGGIRLNQPIVGMAPTPDGRRLLAGGLRRGIFSLGDAAFYGSPAASDSTSPSWAWPPTPPARATGWWPPTAASSASVTPPSTAPPADVRLNRPIVGMAATPDGKGYWLVASDGGIFTSVTPSSTAPPATSASKPILSMAATPNRARLLVRGLRRRRLQLRRRPLLRQPRRPGHHRRHRHGGRCAADLAGLPWRPRTETRELNRTEMDRLR